MAAITAALVKEFREKTGLPMMDCKRALQEADGDPDKALELLRKAGQKKMEEKSGSRTTAEGRVAVYVGDGVGAMVELQCESAPVATHEEFIALADGLARRLATGPGAATAGELLAQPSPNKDGQTLKEELDDLYNRIREVFKVARIVRIDGTCGGYMHHRGEPGVLIQYEGGDEALAKDICMHIAAMRPTALSKEEVPAEVVAKEREILTEAARNEGKPESIIDKMVEGRLRDFFAQQCLLEQAFVKEPKKTVGEMAKEGGMKLLCFKRWSLGE